MRKIPGIKSSPKWEVWCYRIEGAEMKLSSESKQGVKETSKVKKAVK
jgi:hypothetical protein